MSIPILKSGKTVEIPGLNDITGKGKGGVRHEKLPTTQNLQFRQDHLEL